VEFRHPEQVERLVVLDADGLTVAVEPEILDDTCVKRVMLDGKLN